MNARTLSRALRNDVFKVICEEGLEPYISQFEWQEVEARYGFGKESQLCCKRDDVFFYFRFHFNGEYCRPIYFPGKTMNVADIGTNQTWNETLSILKEWIGRIKREFEEPDYWKQISGLQSPFLLEVNIADESPISAFQAAKLKEGISLLHSRLVREFSLTEGQSELILRKLNYLIGAIERQSKTDWVNIAFSTFAMVAMQIGVSAANADKFWGLVKDSLHVAFQLMIGS